MKCNIRELAHLSDQPCIIEGRLNYKKIFVNGYRHHSVFKERWFRLIKNYLFYFKISEMGNFDSHNPAGVFVMENSSIQMEHEQNLPFSFSISFIDEYDKKHIFAARSEDNVVQWVIKLRECSYEYLRNKLHSLQSKIYSITAKDPLLLVPRNEGACLWAPSVPYSTASACKVNNSSFSCHLHTNGAFTLERSKSDVQAHQNLVKQNKSTFYTDDAGKKKNKRDGIVLERSKTSVIFKDNSVVIDTTIFDNQPAFSRAAPSPPVRVKFADGIKKSEENLNMKLFTEQSKNLASTSLKVDLPVPPRRKTSPKAFHSSSSIATDNEQRINCNSSDDLIKF